VCTALHAPLTPCARPVRRRPACRHYKSDCWSARAAPEASSSRKRACRRPAPNSTGSDAAPACTQLALAPPGWCGPFAAGGFDLSAAGNAPLACTQLALHAPPALPDRTFATLHAAEAQVLDMMSPCIDAAAAAWAGPSSREAYAREGGRGLTWQRVRTIEGALEASNWLEAVCETRLRALRAWRDTLGEDGERQLAYTVDAAFNSPECELEALRHGLRQGSASTHAAAAALALPDGSLRPQDAAWVDDFRRGHAAALRLVADGHALVARQRMEPLRSYLDVAEAVLEGMQRYTRHAGRALRCRVAWTSETCVALGDAAGCRVAAASAVAPLVARMRLLQDDEQGARLLALATTPPPRGMPPPPFELAAPL
jgi:hypothetical protein